MAISPKRMGLLCLSTVPIFFGSAPALAASSSADAPQALETRAAAHDGYARLVFDGSTTGGIAATSSEISGSNLTVHFAHPVRMSLDIFKTRLASYLDDLKLDDSGTVLSAHLRRHVTLRQQHVGQGVEAIDLLDAATPAANTPQVAAVPAAPEKAPTPAAPHPEPAAQVSVPIHVSRDKGIDRLTFEPMNTVTVTAQEQDGQAKIFFDRPIRIHTARVAAAMPAALRPLTLAPDGKTLSFPLPTGRHLHQTADESSVMIDVLAAVRGDSPVAASARPVPIEPPASKPAAPVQIAAAPPAAPKTTPADLRQADRTTKPATPAPPATIPSSGGFQLVTTLADDGAVSLRFNWPTSAAAAIFRRDNTVWIVFDQADTLDPGDCIAVSRGALTALTQVSSRSGTVIRAVTRDGLYPWVRRAGTTWIVDLRPRKQPVDESILPTIRIDASGAVVDFQALDPGSPIGIIDPESKDIVIAVPLPQLGQGSNEMTEYPDFRVLSSAQGLAFRPYTDQLSVHQQAGQVEVTSPGGLMISDNGDRGMAPRPASASSKLLDPKDWAGPPTAANFTTRKSDLRRAAATAAAADRTNARLDLAKYYFAHGLAPETLGVLRTAEIDVPNLADDPMIRLMQGAAEEMAGQLDVAATDLGNPTLDGRADTLMWRAALAADQGNWKDAASFALQGKDVLDDYPPVLSRKLALPAAEALLRSGNTREASDLADFVLKHEPSQGEKDLATVLKGRIAGQNGDIATAMKTWQGVSDSPSMDLGRARARFALIVTKYDKGQASLSDTIIALDRLRYVWRGDDYEVTVLRKLADLYEIDGNYPLAFQTLQRIPAIFPDTTAAKDALDRMQGMFADLFLGPQADKVPPISSVSVYQDFKELTPPGDKGDEIIRKLADRLVAVDLLGRAGDLLQDQAKNRLTGVPQARVAVQLALVRLMDNRPADALSALGLIGADGLPPDLMRQEQELRARALAETDQPDQALTALNGDDTADSDKLRSDIYVKTQRWLPLAALMQKSLQDVSPTEKLDSTKAAIVLRAAVCLVLGGDRTGVQSLQQRFGAAMDDSPEYKDAFRVVAGGIDSKSADFQTLADKVAQVGDLQSFMSGYRQKVQQEKLSSIN